jgi:hypothetical protein
MALVALLVLLIAPSVYAQTDVFEEACRSNPNAALCQAKDEDTPIAGEDGLIIRVARLIATIVGVVAVIVIIIGGLQYMLAAGDSAKINNAKNAILYALIGLVVAVIAQFIILFVIGAL